MFTRDELLAAVRTVTGAEAPPTGGPLPLTFAGAAVDSRIVQPGELFIALKGERTDGHRYIGAAIAAGAAAVLCTQPDAQAAERGVAQLVVADPLAVLQTLAQQHLASQPATRVIGIAGSNGKTSVKEATGSLLAHLAPTLKPVGSFNTEVGVPLTLLRLTPEHRFAVLEMGAQRLGEVALLCRIAPPQIGVVTVIGPEHLEFFGSMENVVLAEGEVIDALAPDGIAILNADDADVRGMAARTSATILTYGQDPDADVRARDVAGDPLTGLSFTLAYRGVAAPVQLRLPGAHMVSVALAAAAVALAVGMDVPAVAAALGELRPATQRGEIKRAVNGATLVDDSYNANRQSALAALALLGSARLAPGGRRWFVFGDMTELGSFSPQEHTAVGTAAATQTDELVLIGSDVAATAAAATAAGLPAAQIHLYQVPLDQAAAVAEARRAAIAYLRAHLTASDLILVKGSHSVGMEAIVAELVEPA